MGESYNDVVKYDPSVGMYSAPSEGMVFISQGGSDWSLSRYRQVLSDQKEEDESLNKEWDALERSVLAKLADEVKVGIKDGTVDVVVEKKL